MGSCRLLSASHSPQQWPPGSDLRPACRPAAAEVFRLGLLRIATARFTSPKYIYIYISLKSHAESSGERHDTSHTHARQPNPHLDVLTPSRVLAHFRHTYEPKLTLGPSTKELPTRPWPILHFVVSEAPLSLPSFFAALLALQVRMLSLLGWRLRCLRKPDVPW